MSQVRSLFKAYDDGGQGMSPEQRLWFSLLMITIYDSMGITPYLTVLPKKDEPDIFQARGWILDENKDRNIPGFIWVCESLDIDALSIRNFIKKAIMISPDGLCAMLTKTLGTRLGLHKVYSGRQYLTKRRSKVERRFAGFPVQ